MSTTEVTWDQFRQFVEATDYKTEAETSGLGGKNREFKDDPKINWRNPGWKPDRQEPVTQVTPRDAEAFCAWLSRTGTPARLPPDNEIEDKNEDKTGKSAHPTFRLPTEAEWIHACRAGSAHKHVFGPDPQDLAEYAWTTEFLDPKPQASPLHLVAQKKPNPFGLHDTLGNVWEYTSDWLSVALLSYLTTNDPRTQNGHMNVGSGWFFGPQSTTYPEYVFPGGAAAAHLGFRVLKQFDDESFPGPLDRPLVLRPGQPMSVHALVSRPEVVAGLRSWSVELAGPYFMGGHSIAASPDGKLIATGGLGKISLWDSNGKYQRALLGHEGVIKSLNFSPDGRWLASCDEIIGIRGHGGDTARIWNVATGAMQVVVPIHKLGKYVAFSPNSEQLAVSFGDYSNGPFLIVDLRTGATRTPATTEVGEGFAWSPDGKRFACSTTANRLRICDAMTLKLLQEIECPVAYCVAWSPDGEWLALCSTGKVVIRNANSLEATQTFGSGSSPYSANTLHWFPDNRRLAALNDDNQSGIYDTTTGTRLNTLVPRALRANGTEAVTFGNNGGLTFSDTATADILREGPQPASLAGDHSVLTEDGGEVFSAGLWAGKIRVLDSLTGQLKREFPGPINGDTNSRFRDRTQTPLAVKVVLALVG